jgi:hypothetical protein
MTQLSDGERRSVHSLATATYNSGMSQISTTCTSPTPGLDGSRNQFSMSLWPLSGGKYPMALCASSWTSIQGTWRQNLKTKLLVWGFGFSKLRREPQEPGNHLIGGSSSHESKGSCAMGAVLCAIRNTSGHEGACSGTCKRISELTDKRCDSVSLGLQ